MPFMGNPPLMKQKKNIADRRKFLRKGIPLIGNHRVGRTTSPRPIILGRNADSGVRAIGITKTDSKAAAQQRTARALGNTSDDCTEHGAPPAPVGA